MYPGNDASAFGLIHNFIASAGQEMLNKAEGERSGVLGTTGVKLALYKDPVVASNICESGFRVQDLMNSEHPVSLYLVLPPSDEERLTPLTRLILSIIIHRLTETLRKPKHRLLLLMDEFSNLGNLAVFEKALAYMAGYGLKAYIIVQDVEQISKKYGQHNAILSNCHVRSAFAPNKVETAKVISDLLGKTTVVEEKISLSGSRSGVMKNASQSINETGRALLTPDECMRLPGLRTDPGTGETIPGDMIIFIAGQPPIYGRQLLYFQVPELLTRTRIPVPPPAGESERKEERKETPEEKPKVLYEDFLEN
jgi:type IV secretion system protein VirD4